MFVVKTLIELEVKSQMFAMWPSLDDVCILDYIPATFGCYWAYGMGDKAIIV